MDVLCLTLRCTLKSLKSIHPETGTCQFHISLVDDGSDDGSDHHIPPNFVCGLIHCMPGPETIHPKYNTKLCGGFDMEMSACSTLLKKNKFYTI